MARIDIPRNPTELITLAKAISAKHAELGAASPLAALADWPKRQTALSAAEAQDATAAKLVRDTDTAYEARDLEIERAEVGVQATVRQVRDLLLALNPKNPAMLGDFGFDVDVSPAPSAPTPPRS